MRWLHELLDARYGRASGARLGPESVAITWSVWDGSLRNWILLGARAGPRASASVATSDASECPLWGR